jgi:ribosomal protein S18 acetylase RimI-like enzyme
MPSPKLICKVRPMTHADIPGVIALQERAFRKMPPWTREELEGHLATFPEGQIVAVDPSGRVVGSASSLMVHWHPEDDLASWDEITGCGSFRTHDPTGNTLYGADVGVDPDAHAMGIGSKLYEARRAIARAYNVQRIVAGGRIPGYGELADRMSAQDYVQLVLSGAVRDPVLNFQLKNGFRVRGVIPGYLPYDDASCAYATLIEWVNPAYHEEKPAA